MDIDDFGRDAASIEQAYVELTKSAFAVWIRLMTATPEQLSGGRDRLAKMLGYTEPRASGIFKELSRKGYMRVESSGPYRPTKFILLKRLILKGEDHIIKLG